MSLFGTDGIRAPFGAHPLDRRTVTALALRLAEALAEQSPRPRVVLGGDTRDSTPEICRWLAAGLAAGGARVEALGVVPTPAVARLVRRRGAACGIAVSASHNPHPDNGIKLIDQAGYKWSPEREADLERRLLAAGPELPPGEPELAVDPRAAEEYLDDLAATLPGELPLAGLRVVLDAAHGAATPFAGRLFARLGADVQVLNDRPDGRNINRGCGSTQPAGLAAAVVRAGADLGVAFDGDADRAVLVDEGGEVRDGDAMLYLWAKGLAAEGTLAPPRIVATSMSNLGLERALARHGVGLTRCPVGDREVVDTLRREGLLLGGEQSGHVVHLGLATTGDGLLTALHLAHRVRRSGEPLSRLLQGFVRYPQVLVNVAVARKPDLGGLPGVAAAARGVEERLGEDGRLVLRYSGTEPLARIMIEGPDQGEIEALAGELAEVIRQELGGAP